MHRPDWKNEIEEELPVKDSGGKREIGFVVQKACGVLKASHTALIVATITRNW